MFLQEAQERFFLLIGPNSTNLFHSGRVGRTDGNLHQVSEGLAHRHCITSWPAKARHPRLCCHQQGRTYAGGSGSQALDRVRYASHSTREQPMRIETQPQDHPTATPGETARLLVSFELSQSKWVLTVRAPASAKLWRFTVPSRDTEKVSSLLTAQRQQAERRTARPVQIVSIYEAGLDGFWLHRWLETQE